MFRRTDNASAPNVVKKCSPTVISSGLSMLGNIVSDGIIDFDGTIDGNIKCHTIVIRQNAVIRGEVEAQESIQVFGQVKGLIRAKLVHMHPGCNVEATIMHEVLTIEEGANVDGKFKRMSGKPSDDEASSNDNMQPQFSMPSEAETTINPQFLEGLKLIASN